MCVWRMRGLGGIGSQIREVDDISHILVGGHYTEMKREVEKRRIEKRTNKGKKFLDRCRISSVRKR